MKFAAALALAVPAMGESSMSGNSAIEKVVEMLTNMGTKGKQELDKEKAGFAAYNTWALGVKQEKEADIEDGKTLSSKLEGLIAAEQGTAAEAQQKIQEYSEIHTNQKEDVKAITKTRTEERGAFVKEEQDLTDSIYACDKAKEVLESIPEKVPQKSMFFTQMNSLQKTAGANDKLRALMEFLQSTQDPFRGARERSSATDSIIEMVADLKQDFEGQIQSLRKKEKELEHAYGLEKQTAEQTIEDAEKQTQENKDILADAQEEEGKLAEELNTAKKNLSGDEKYLAKVSAEHKIKSSDFQQRKKARTDELTAIKKAVEIMKSPQVAAGGGQLEGNKQVGGPSATSFIQMRSTVHRSHGAEGDSESKTSRIAAFLRSRGEEIGSKILVQIAEVAQADPFAKIKKMIGDMITRLEKEHAETKTKNAWCVENIKKNKEETEHYTQLSEKLSAQCDKLETEIGDAKELIAKLTKEQDELAKAVEKASTNRATEKAENETTIKESTVAAAAITDAVEILKKYYSGDSSFVQQPDAEGSQPAYAGGEYKPMTESNGVVGLMEVLLEEMNTLASSTRAGETDASESHKEFLKISKKSAQEKKTLKNTTEVQQTQLEEDLTDKKDDLTEAKKGLKEVVTIKKESIDPQCIAQGVSFAEKQGKRQEEIDSLTEALKVLNEM